MNNLITIFTPVYNRAKIINKLYESIKQQTFKNFEWLVVNDGSTDDINEVMNQIKGEASFPVRYYIQPNGGKHRAINKGISLANGELFFIVDSDDIILPDALEWLNYYYEQVKNDKRFAGVSGYRCLPNHDEVYIRPKADVLDCTNLDFGFKYNQIGGTAEAYKLSILKQYPFPEIEGEKFCAESLVWNRIAQNYMIRFFNKQIYVWNYLPDGLTNGMIRNRRNSSTYAMMNYSELLTMNISLKWKIKYAINYWRFWFVKNHKQEFNLSPVWYLLLPIGYLYYRKDNTILTKEIPTRPQ